MSSPQAERNSSSLRKFSGLDMKLGVSFDLKSTMCQLVAKVLSITFAINNAYLSIAIETMSLLVSVCCKFLVTMMECEVNRHGQFSVFTVLVPCQHNYLIEKGFHGIVYSD